MKLLQAAITTAGDMGVPQCISIVDAGGHLLAFARMDGAFSQSIDTSLGNAAGVDLKLAITTRANA
jgi:glc operon protein GlcG